MAENCILSKNVKKCVIFGLYQNNIFGQGSLKMLVFYIILLDFLSIFGDLESLNDVKIWSFFFNGHFLIIMGFKI